MQSLKNYLNPLARLGIKKYSVIFPVFLNILVSIGSEIYAYNFAQNPNIVGTYIIFINVGLIIYFSFRDGIRGGIIASSIATLYYLYIIQTREYASPQWERAVETTFVLTLLYFILASTIGWLKQRIDNLIIQETEARQAAEEGKLRLETILQQLPVGVLLVNAKSKKIEKNRHLEQLIGPGIQSTLEKNLNYRSPVAFKDGRPLMAKEWPLIRALSSGEIISGEEIEYKNDQKKLHLRINAAPIKNRQKEIVAAVSTIDDITTEKELEKRKDDFVNMASHELKTPLTSLKIYIEVLLKLIQKYEDPKALKTLNSIKTQTERLQDLVGDLLDVSRIQTGKLHFNKENFRLDQLITEMADVLQGTTQKHRLIVKKHAKCQVYGDRFRIYQVLTNLITNAIKYSPNGDKIIIDCKKDQKKVIVSVKDYGIGISKGQQKKIFERLYQVTDAPSKTYPGLGMGLYISKEIIKRHQGNIWVEGDKGKGSTFYFSLPIK